MAPGELYRLVSQLFRLVCELSAKVVTRSATV